jgi:hypothetical protein
MDWGVVPMVSRCSTTGCGCGALSELENNLLWFTLGDAPGWYGVAPLARGKGGGGGVERAMPQAGMGCSFGASGGGGA